MCVDLVGAVVAVFLLAILYEGLKTFREYLVFMDWRHSHQHAKDKAALAALHSVQESESEEEGEEDDKGCTDQSFILARMARKRRRSLAYSRRKGYVGKGRLACMLAPDTPTSRIT